MNKENEILRSVLNDFNIGEQATIESFGSGLINNTWIVADAGKRYILQRINDNVFKNPEDIAFNIEYLSGYVKSNFPEYKFVVPLTSLDGSTLVFKDHHGYFRVFPFIQASHTIDVVETPGQAYEAAAQFGKFTRILNGADVSVLKKTIPDFHNLTLRYHQFLSAVELGNVERITQAASLINDLRNYSSIVIEYEKIITNKNFIKRVTHHDTKISNVLFDEHNKGICVIDLDTAMPGYFISDLGDMMRTYLSPVSEEEQALSKINIREEFYEAIVNGYYNEMKEVLTEAEKNYFFYAGCFMIYMQALRFLTDFLNNDPYYSPAYPEHNYCRAKNQAVLLQRLFEMKSVLVGRLKVSG